MRPWSPLFPALAALGLVLLASPAGAIWPFAGRDWPDPAKDLPGAAAAILSRSIRFRTVNPPGDERPLAEYLVEVLQREGVTARAIETPTGDSKVGRAAVWARLPGSGARRPIILHSHLDVVPAESEEWMVGPFLDDKEELTYENWVQGLKDGLKLAELRTKADALVPAISEVPRVLEKTGWQRQLPSRIRSSRGASCP